MTHSPLAATLAATLLAGQTLAADAPKNDGFRIESEDQFVRDYGDLVERAGPDVYRMTAGPLAGEVVTPGESGGLTRNDAVRPHDPVSASIALL